MEAKELREQLKGTDEKYYEVTVTLQVDDETEEDKTYFFRKPKTPSYDRYLKTVQTSNSKALTAFCLDNIHPDQRETLEADFKEYPAMALSVGEKLLAMLGLSKATAVKSYRGCAGGTGGGLRGDQPAAHPYVPAFRHDTGRTGRDGRG